MARERRASELEARDIHRFRQLRGAPWRAERYVVLLGVGLIVGTGEDTGDCDRRPCLRGGVCVSDPMHADEGECGYPAERDQPGRDSSSCRHGYSSGMA